jgi:short subunit dehydrogenase-like uncharacterized protein
MTSIASMALLNRQDGPIALYGATGYTGRLVAAELAAAKADFVLSGRNRRKLDSLAEELGGNAAVQPAALDDDAALRSLLSDCAAVIDCAGPFIRHGEPVLRAAVETETHYLDTTGEQPYIQMAFDRYGPGAEAAGVAVIPAMGFDYVPGDMLASLTARGMGELDEIALSYAWRGFQPSHGTARSALEILSGEDVEWKNLKWQSTSCGFGRGSFDFPEPIGRQPVSRYPAGEVITVPNHTRTNKVTALLTLGTMAPRPLAPVLPYAMPGAALALRTPVRGLLNRAVGLLPEGPKEDDRRAARYTIVARAQASGGTRQGVVRGSDVYGTTAVTLVHGAELLSAPGFDRAGALGPAAAFDPAAFLNHAEVSWQLD